MAGAVLNVSSQTGIPQMLPGVTFTAPTPPTTPAVALPAGVPVLGIGTMTILIHGDVQVVGPPGLSIQVAP
jgi:hypothetical protein